VCGEEHRAVPSAHDKFLAAHEFDLLALSTAFARIQESAFFAIRPSQPSSCVR
jgi:hypothetical protein